MDETCDEFANVIVLVIGTLVGLEIPLLMRLVKGRYRFQDAVSHVLTFDDAEHANGRAGAGCDFRWLKCPMSNARDPELARRDRVRSPESLAYR